jgi:hypothetical protein
MEQLALTENSTLIKNKKQTDTALSWFKKHPNATLNRPSSLLAQSLGLSIEGLYDKFIPLMCEEKNIAELAAYTDMAIDILHFTDSNMWRSLLPEQYFFVLDRVVDVIKELTDKDNEHPNWLKRRGLKMYMRIADVQAEKRRFFQYVATEDRIKEIQEAMQRQKELEKEIEVIDIQ